MKVTILGKSPAWSDAGGACSGYLVEHGDDALVLDCGTGVLASLRQLADYADVRHVVLSHMHADHVLDLVPFAVALTYSPRGPLPRPALHVPPGGTASLAELFEVLHLAPLLTAAYDVREHAADAVLEVGAMRLRFAAVEHFIPSLAVSVEAPDGTRLVYSGDSSPTPALVELSRGADLLLCEATLLEPSFGHMTAREAGEHAAAAGARRLVLTHYSDEVDAAAHRAAAAEAFGGPIDLAVAHATFDLTS
ncbi:MAG TPA: MBL fold metallo-hydrolase [Solirubrobacteraceae bacterium]|nr:MBL fold metallo-hydrolase [Solirubrobacteraceae bacterium]